MNEAMTKLRGFTFNKRNVKRMISVAVIIAIASGAIYYGIEKFKPAAKTTLTQQTAKVMRGDFNITVAGEGSVASSNSTEITSAIAGKLTKVYFKKGDTVKEGDLLYELDDSSGKLNVEKIKSSLAQAELTQKNYYNQLANLSVKAPFSGIVSGMSLMQGDTINKGANILTITDESQYKFTVPFNSSQINEITVGKSVNVNIMSLMQSVSGTVSYINNTAYSTSTGGTLYNVEITVANPGSLKEGMLANAEIQTSAGTISSTDNGSLAYINKRIIKSDNAGAIQKINIKDGQYVSEGTVLAEISSDDLAVNIESNNVKILDYKSQLETALADQSKYKIYSYINGTIVSQNLVPGDNVKVNEVLSTIIDLTQMECSIPVDELDISKIKIGQKVNIVADALTETAQKPLQGEVTNIAVVGTSSNGVTNYPVTVKINKPDGLRAGMNVSVNIFIESKSGVLYLPIQAIQKVRENTFVMVKGDGTSGGSLNMLPADAAGNGQGGNSSANSGNGQGGNSSANSGNRQGANGSGNAGNRQGANGSGNAANRQGANNSGSGQNAGNTGSAANGKTANKNGNASNSTGSGSSSQQPAAWRYNQELADYYAGLIMKPVKVGINNETYIEITEGLSEGDEVVLPPANTGTSSNANNAQRNQSANPLGGVMGGAMGGGFGGTRPTQGNAGGAR